MRALRGFACGLLIFAACSDHAEPHAPTEADVRVEVEGVKSDAGQNLVVMLEDPVGGRILPIWIGIAEAQSIAAKLENVDFPRPNTHDLTRNVVEQLGGSLERVVVTELRGSTYYAILELETRDGRKQVDSRPSDAIAIALRTGSPIYVRESLFTLSKRDALLERNAPRLGL